MTFLEIVNTFKTAALAQPNVNQFERTFLDLNREDVTYSAIVLQDKDGVTEIYSGEQRFFTFSWYLGYIDRLTEDESNRDHIFSTGISIINNIINNVRNTFFPSIEVTVSDRWISFDQRFTGNCAGVYVAITASIPQSDCADYETSFFTSMSRTITSNGTYNYTAEGTAWDSVNITVSTPQRKEEETLVSSIASNGDYSFTPAEGKVFSSANIAVDVHPSVSLSQTYTSNGVYALTGEWKDGSVTVEVSGGGGSTTVSLTQAEYDVLATKDPNTIYLIIG